MKYIFIAAHVGQFSIRGMCRVLRVQRSGYYAWQRRSPSSRAQANATLWEHIQDEHAASRQTYGAPRIQVVLRRKGIVCGRKRVARLMRANGLRALPARKKHPVTTQRAAGVVPAPNRLSQDFHATVPNQKWVSDFTYIETDEGWLYLAVVLDLFSRKVIGWAMRDTMDTPLVLAALQMALLDRLHPLGCCITPIRAASTRPPPTSTALRQLRPSSV